MENDVNCSATCLSVVSMDYTAGFVLSHLVLLSGDFVVNMPPLFNIHCSITKLDYSFLFVPVDLDQKWWRYSEPIGLEHTASIVCATNKGA